MYHSIDADTQMGSGPAVFGDEPVWYPWKAKLLGDIANCFSNRGLCTDQWTQWDKLMDVGGGCMGILLVHSFYKNLEGYCARVACSPQFSFS
jgi:hypothetical protein